MRQLNALKLIIFVSIVQSLTVTMNHKKYQIGLMYIIKQEKIINKICLSFMFINNFSVCFKYIIVFNMRSWAIV